MIALKVIVPIELKDFVILSIESYSISNFSCFEDESSPISNFLDEDNLPISSMFIIECVCDGNQFNLLNVLLQKFDITVQKSEVDTLKKYTDILNDIEVFPFFITKNNKDNPNFLYTIKIQAATAFGSGEHQTTKGCLMALAAIENEKPKKIADIGCGSGILGIAACKLWKGASVKCIDNDQESVKISNFHKDINNSEIEVIFGDGAKPILNSDDHFDLIISNILAKPLIAFADDFLKKSKKYIILSGFLQFQKNDVLNAYPKTIIKKEIIIDDWVTLILEKINS